MKNVISDTTVLEITPTNIKYTTKDDEINKTFMLTKEKLKNNLLKLDFSTCSKNPSKLQDKEIPPASFVYFMLFAQKSKIPHPKNITDKYIDLFCVKKENGKYQFNEKFIIDKQIEFDYSDLFSYICKQYNAYTCKLMLLAGLSKNHLDLDMWYEYKNEILYNIDISIIYKECIFLLTSSKNIGDVLKNKDHMRMLREKYKQVFVISIYSNFKDDYEKTNSVLYFKDEYDKKIFEIMDIKIDTILLDEEKLSEIDVPETVLDFDKSPFFITGIDNIEYF